MSKKSVKPKMWQGREPKDSLKIVGKQGWVFRNGEVVKGTVVLESKGEVLVAYDSEILKKEQVFPTKRELGMSLAGRILKWRER